MAIKTTKRNQVFIVQKKVSGRWQMITDAIFMRRRNARECSNQLNAIASVTGRGPNRRYRVAIMKVVQPS